MIYLYMKTHLDTKLKYFGKTTNPNYEKYTGSGIYWLRHLKKHGYNVRTNLMFCSDSIEEIEKYALKFSEDNNIVESDEWANLKYENGKDGGTRPEDHTEAARRKMSLNRRGKVGRPTGWKHTEETKKHMSKRAKERCERIGPPKAAFKKGNIPVNKGIPMSEEQKKLVSERVKKQKTFCCPHCGKSTFAGNYARWHGDKCKEKQSGY